MFIERQTKDYQQDFSTTTDHEEYGVQEDHDWDDLNGLCNLETGLIGLKPVRKENKKMGMKQ